jgi:hypothetical protein
MLLRYVGELELLIEVERTHLALLEASWDHGLGLPEVRSLFQHGDERDRELNARPFGRYFSLRQAHQGMLE